MCAELLKKAMESEIIAMCVCVPVSVFVCYIFQSSITSLPHPRVGPLAGVPFLHSSHKL